VNSVLITGVTGFIGRYVADVFAQAGWLVIGLGTQPNINIPNVVQYVSVTLPSDRLEEIIKSIEPDVCIHCAGKSSVHFSVVDPAADFNASVDVTFQLLNYLRLHAPRCKFIYLSSAAVYGNPTILPISETQSLEPISPYGFHKLICEQLCHEFSQVYGLEIAIARIFSAYGNGLKRQVIWDICHKALTQPVLKLQGTGQESRDFIHGIDVARAIFAIAQNSIGDSPVYNLASGQETTIKELADLILLNLHGDRSAKISVEFDGVVPVGNPVNWRADVGRIANIGFLPTVKLAQGIESYAKWCLSEVKS
jgi:UDP-glucose 4-epimerase